MTIATTPLDNDEPHTPSPAGHAENGDVATRIREFAGTEYRRVVATVALWSGSTDDAADAVADALGLAWEKIDKDQPIDNLAAFVTTTAMNRVRTARRRTARFRQKRHLLTAADTTETTDAAIRRLDVADALGHLSQRQQRAVALRYGADLSTAQIAAELGVAEGTVKATLHQARSALADHLDEPTKGAPGD